MGKRAILSERELFFIRLKHGWVSEEKKKMLIDLVMSLEQATIIQKERFISVYNLYSLPGIKYNLSRVAKEQNCSNSAVRSSVVRVKNFLVNLKNVEKKYIFSEIIKDNDYFNLRR